MSQERGGERGEGRGHMDAYGWFMLVYDRNHHNIIIILQLKKRSLSPTKKMQWCKTELDPNSNKPIVNERHVGQLQPVVTILQDASLPLKNSWPGIHTLYTLKQAGTDGGRNTTEVCAIYDLVMKGIAASSLAPWFTSSERNRAQVLRLKLPCDEPSQERTWVSSQQPALTCEPVWRATYKADPAGPVNLSSDSNFRRHIPRTS